MREHAEENHGEDADYVVKNIESLVAEKANDEDFSAEESFVDIDQSTTAVEENEEDDDHEVIFQQLEVKVIHNIDIFIQYFFIIILLFVMSRLTRTSLPAATR